MKGGANGQSLEALLLASMEAKQPREPSHKQSYPLLAEETASVHQQVAVDPIAVDQPFLGFLVTTKLQEKRKGSKFDGTCYQKPICITHTTSFTTTY